MGLRSFIYKVSNAVAELIDNSVKDGTMINYGKKNTFPNNLIAEIDKSGTALQCIDRRSEFLFADGFEDRNVAARIANAKGQTFDEVYAEVCEDFAYFEGYALKYLYNLQGVPFQVERVPFETVRKKAGGGFVVNPTFGRKKFDSTKNKDYSEFNPSLSKEARQKIIASDMANYGGQRGEILYIFRKRPGKNIYPVPTYYAGIEDVESDGGLVTIENENITQGFRTDVVITTVGKLDDQQKDDKGKTEADYFDDTIDEFTEPGRRRILHLQSETKEGLPSVTIFPLNQLLDGIDKARDRVPRAVCRHFGVPPVLVGLTMPEGLGNTNALMNSMKLFNHTIMKGQAMCAAGFKKGFPAQDWTVTTLNLIDFVPDKILEDLTPDERRAIAGYGPAEDQSGANDLLNALSPLVANKILEDLTPDERRAIETVINNLKAKKKGGKDAD
jgi:hypothetical protein